MIRFYRDLYVSSSIKDAEALKEKLRTGAGDLRAYVLTVPAAERDGEQMELFHNVMLHQPWYRDHDVFVIGLAQGRGDAEELAARIVGEAYAATGRADVRAYLFPHGIRVRGEQS